MQTANDTQTTNGYLGAVCLVFRQHYAWPMESVCQLIAVVVLMQYYIELSQPANLNNSHKAQPPNGPWLDKTSTIVLLHAYELGGCQMYAVPSNRFP